MLFTMDVKPLYTCFPNNEGFAALRFFLDCRAFKSPPTNTLIRLAELVFTLNHFEFDGDFYTQKDGVAMGGDYACLYMGQKEHLFRSSYDRPTPKLYKRYIELY